ncbi:FixH family protein [Kaistella palustris]|uniref:FixH family protein n=1 Tax=Kaistella palustris TaxID=493376 RepID=UPI00041391E5|nr:FixH family protein [Kaistella palustris]
MLKKFTWGHGVILALGSFIAFILFMILVFPNGKQNADLVTDDYYTEELNYQQVIDAKNNADALPEKPVYTQKPDGIYLAFPQAILPDNAKIHFDLYRTNDSNLDVKKELQLDSKNSVLIPAKVLSAGSYTLKLKWQFQKKPHEIDYDVQWK